MTDTWTTLANAAAAHIVNVEAFERTPYLDLTDVPPTMYESVRKHREVITSLASDAEMPR